MADTYWSDVKLLLHADGSNGSTTIPDSSSSARTITVGSGCQLATGQKKYGTASISVNTGGATSGSISAASSADFNVGSGFYTLEFWIRFNSLATGYADPNLLDVYCDLSNRWTLSVPGAGIGSGNLRSLSVVAGVTHSKFVAWTPSTGSWYHIAVVRLSSDTLLFVDGVKVLDTAQTMPNLSGELRIGNQGSTGTGRSGTPANAYFDEVRLTKGVARYGVDFTPPTQAFPTHVAASGFAPAAFGTPRARQGFPVASLGLLTQFGSPGARFDQYPQVEGFAPIEFGTPIVAGAYAVSGFKPIAFGSPQLSIIAVGFNPTAFGTPAVKPIAVGFAPTAFGDASVIQRNRVRSMGVVTRFGTPTVPTSRTCEVSGFMPTRFGIVPTAIRYIP